MNVRQLGTLRRNGMTMLQQHRYEPDANLEVDIFADRSGQVS